MCMCVACVCMQTYVRTYVCMSVCVCVSPVSICRHVYATVFCADACTKHSSFCSVFVFVCILETLSSSQKRGRRCCAPTSRLLGCSAFVFFMFFFSRNFFEQYKKKTPLLRLYKTLTWLFCIFFLFFRAVQKEDAAAAPVQDAHRPYLYLGHRY